MMRPYQYNYWIENTLYNNVGILPAKDCKFNKDNFKKTLEKELEDKVKLLTDIQEGYYRIQKSDFFDKAEYGDYCYKPCEKDRGATLYYYAGFEYIGGTEC